MIVRIFTLLFLITGLSCKEEITYPDVPIPKEKLVNIMIDLSLAQGAVANYKTRDKDSIRAVYRYQIQEIYDIPIQTIDSTLKVIYQDVALNKEIQQMVLDSLKYMEEESGRIKNKKSPSN